MHAASMALMKDLRSRIAPGSRILDVGGADVNGSYRSLFPGCEYVSLDYQHADVVVSGYGWPIEDESFDAVVSGQALEHDRFFWVTLRNIARVLRPGGVAVLIVPSQGPIHRHPVDCYRFLPDAMDAMAAWAGLVLLHRERRMESPWGDLAGVFQKPET